jgi:3-oxoacyl-[acyl-carrier-protein] synthase II
VRFGLAEQALAVCSDSGLDEASFSAWNRLGVLTKNPDPVKASRPFDRNRDGLVMGEGAAAFFLEPLEAARARGANILAEIAGYGTSSDAGHIVVPEVAGQVKAIRTALRNAGVRPEEIDYVNAHGTSTQPADKAEAAALIEALGDAGRRVPVSNTKAQLGHLMGATAGVELAATILAMRKGEIFPSRNLDDPDPECPLNFVRGEPLRKELNVVLKNSFAFGGTNSVIVLRKV